MNAWRWLEANKGAIGALTAIVGVAVAIAGVIVASIYARLTRRLADTARDQTALTKEIATETRRQARISQQVFEASHRPVLEVNLERGGFVDDQHFGFHFTVKNHGSVPAINVRSTVVCRMDDKVVVERPSQVPHVLFPGEERSFSATSNTAYAVQPPPRGLRVEATVDYNSTAGRGYFTKFFFESEGSGWKLTHEEIGETAPGPSGED